MWTVETVTLGQVALTHGARQTQRSRTTISPGDVVFGVHMKSGSYHTDTSNVHCLLIYNAYGSGQETAPVEWFGTTRHNSQTTFLTGSPDHIWSQYKMCFFDGSWAASSKQIPGLCHQAAGIHQWSTSITWPILYL